MEDMEEVDIRGPDLAESLEQARVVRIGFVAPEPLKEELRSFLRGNTDVCAWMYDDMQGIDLRITTHHLNVSPRARPVKQKRRSFAPEHNEAIADEIDKLVQAKFIKEAHYPT